MDTLINKNNADMPQMLIFKKIDDLSTYLDELRIMKKKIGFVPTMGALHQGHLSLVEKAKQQNDIVVVSIFVNPTQFNNADDLKNYPHTPEEDIRLLEGSFVDILFSPEVNEIYNSEKSKEKILDPGSLGTTMEGAHRPGHFSGVIQIVSRLFDIVKPEKAYFGEKDFQQLAIIRFMVKKLVYPVEIIACPTIRETTGLAMSSRNLKLSREGREEATKISKALFYVKENYLKYSPKEVLQEASGIIESTGKLKIEYIEVADEETLSPVNDWVKEKHVRCFTAVFCEKIRLIDNIRLY